MKYLLVLLVVVATVWMLLKRSRQDSDADNPPVGDKPRPKAPSALTEMVACLHCGVHLPRTESVVDRQGGTYCSAAHRDAGPR